MEARSDPARRTGVLAAALVLGLLGSGALVWRGTAAVWTSSTGNAASRWTAGSIGLSDNDAGTQLFNLSGLLPGDTGSKCILVTYGGTAPSVPVRLYATGVTDAASLGAAIDLTIETGTYAPNAGDPLNCAAGTFSGATTVYDATHPGAGTGTLAAFYGTYTAYSSGLTVWTATTGAPTKGFRFTYTLKASTDTSLQGTSATVGFQWETQA